MGKFIATTKWFWGRIADIWLAKDLFLLVIGGGTTVGAVVAPFAVWAFSPLSPFDVILLAVLGAVGAFVISTRLAKRFVPRAIHHVALGAIADLDRYDLSDDEVSEPEAA